jgi:hypothetical protein
MVERQHTPSHLPWFITEPGQTDWLMLFTAIFLLVFVATVGVLMMRLLYLPLMMASQEQKVQYEIVGVPCILAMFSPGNFLWIAAVLVASIEFPDFTPLFDRIADAIQRISEARVLKK